MRDQETERVSNLKKKATRNYFNSVQNKKGTNKGKNILISLVPEFLNGTCQNQYWSRWGLPSCEIFIVTIEVSVIYIIQKSTDEDLSIHEHIMWTQACECECTCGFQHAWAMLRHATRPLRSKLASRGEGGNSGGDEFQKGNKADCSVRTHTPSRQNKRASPLLHLNVDMLTCNSVWVSCSRQETFHPYRDPVF